MTRYENIRRGVAIASAGTLGYIAAGPSGALFAASLANKSLPKRKQSMAVMKRRGSTVSNRPTKKLKISRKRKSRKTKRTYKTKCPKLSKCTTKSVRDIVNKVLSKKDPTGTYIKNCGYAAIKPTLTLIVNKQMVSDTIFNSAGASIYPLNFFTPQSFIDAASILFNGKTAALGIGGVGDFTDPELKFLVQYASVKITITNFIQQRIKLLLYEVTSKDLENDFFFDEYKDSLEATNLNQTGGTVATVFDVSMRPTLISSLRKRYKIVTKEYLLDAGDIVSHYMKVSNYKFNRSNYMDGNVLQNFTSVSKQLLYAYEPVMCPGIPNTGSVPAIIGRQYPTITGANAVINNGMITFECNEKYIIDAPPTTSVANAKDTLATFQGYEADTTTESVVAFRNDRLSTMALYQRT